MSQRTDRVDELLRQEIGAILARDVQDPRIGFATITDVETTPDLRHARVWVSVIGPEPERAETLAALQRAMGFVRHELGRRLRIKRIPDLHIRLDETAERGTRILRLLSELEEGSVPGDLPEGETLPTPVPRIHREGDADEPDPDESEPDEPAGAGQEPSAPGAAAGSTQESTSGRTSGRGPGRGGGRAAARHPGGERRQKGTSHRSERARPDVARGGAGPSRRDRGKPA